MNTHTYEDLAALHAIAKALAQPWDLRDQLEQVLNEMKVRLGMQRGMISLLDRDSGESWLEVAHGVDAAVGEHVEEDVAVLQQEGVVARACVNLQENCSA